MLNRLDARLPALLAAVVFASCATIDQACRESSDSSGSGSASHSFGSGAAASAGAMYQADVISFTVASLDRDDARGDLLRGIGRIAEQHGISNWEAAPETMSALRSVVTGSELDDAERAKLKTEIAPLGSEAIQNAFGAQG